MNTHFRNTALTAAIVLALSACTGVRDGEGAADSGAPAGETVQPTMKGMPGMTSMGAGTMIEQMQSHMRMMDATGTDSILAKLPDHRQMVANMISQFGNEMREMNMKADPAWTATIDSLRQDNIQMPDMSARELHAFMPGHSARVSRLVEMHRLMMAKM